MRSARARSARDVPQDSFASRAQPRSRPSIWCGFVAWLCIVTRRGAGIHSIPIRSTSSRSSSLEAIFLSIWILIGQNEMERLADRRAHLDLKINMVAEQESTAAVRMLQRISERLGIPQDDTVDTALAEETDLERIVTAIDQTVPS
jgi:hypothetical protein